MLEDRTRQAQDWAVRVRRLEAQAMAWIYESETDAVASLARRTLAQATGLRRLLDQIGGCVSTPGKE